MSKSNERYNERYFRKISSLPNWELDGKNMAKVMYELFNPKSVIDFGCGTGRILANLYDFGCEVKGIEKNIDHSIHFMSDKIEKFVIKGDVTDDIKPLKKYDLVVCTEVAEHIDPNGSSVLISNLCSHSDLIVFSAAPPEQLAPGHINLHPIEYWKELFLFHSFEIDKNFTERYKRSLIEHNVKKIYINNGYIFRKS